MVIRPIGGTTNRPVLNRPRPLAWPHPHTTRRCFDERASPNVRVPSINSGQCQRPLRVNRRVAGRWRIDRLSGNSSIARASATRLHGHVGSTHVTLVWHNTQRYRASATRIAEAKIFCRQAATSTMAAASHTGLHGKWHHNRRMASNMIIRYRQGVSWRRRPRMLARTSMNQTGGTRVILGRVSHSARGAHHAHSETSSCLVRSLSVAPVGIIEAHDVILAEIGTRLHFDQLQGYTARIFQPVFDAKWNIG